MPGRCPFPADSGCGGGRRTRVFPKSGLTMSWSPEFFALAHCLSEPILLVARDTTIQTVNRAATREFRRGEEDLVGHALGEVSASPREALFTYLRACSRYEEPRVEPRDPSSPASRGLAARAARMVSGDTAEPGRCRHCDGRDGADYVAQQDGRGADGMVGRAGARPTAPGGLSHSE